MVLPRRRLAALGPLAAAISAAPLASALVLELDYGNQAFFNGNVTAKAAVDAAAADLSAAITTFLAPLNTDVFTGTAPDTSFAEFDFSFGYTNPFTGAAETIATPTSAADTVTIYVGQRFLTGNTLGQGGPGGAGIGIQTSSFNQTSLATAVADANAQSNAALSRNAGPTIGSLSGSVGSANYDVSYGIHVGNLWFDSDTDNNNVEDFNGWHLDHTAPVAAGKSDLYSVALHELLHAIGIGSSESWDAMVDGTDWLGANANALNGTGIGLIDADGGHIAADVQSVTIDTNMMQEVVMDPNLTTGTRKTLTQLDLAFLQDIGYETVAIPEPGTALLAAGFGLLTLRRRRAG